MYTGVFNQHLKINYMFLELMIQLIIYYILHN